MHWALGLVEAWLLIWFVLVGWKAFMQRAYGHRSPFNLLELHHAYIGAALVFVGWKLHSVTGVFIELGGLVLTIDDHCQHLVQTYSEDREYQSPLHELFGKTLWKIRWMPALVRFLDARWWAIALLAMAAVLVLGCRPASPLIRLVPRPDSRHIGSFAIDSALTRQMAEAFAAVLPRERALCLDGTVGPDPDWAGLLHVQITSFRPAQSDSADIFHVYFPRSPTNGCAGPLIAITHDHTTVGPTDPCTHSDPDAFVLFEDRRALFSLVFCGAGRGEVLFQDGRRGAFVWSHPDPVPP